MKHSGRPNCKQPLCPLKSGGASARNLAVRLVQARGKVPSDILDFASGAPSAQPRCLACAARVAGGRNAFLTEAEWDYLDDMGRWHGRRHRRRERFAALGTFSR